MTIKEIATKGALSFEDQVTLSKYWLQEWVTPRRSNNRDTACYSMKHSVEKYFNSLFPEIYTYIPKEALIEAAIRLGYIPTNKGREYGTYFNMSFVKAKKHRKESFYKMGA